MIGLNRRRMMGNSKPYDAEIEYLSIVAKADTYFELPIYVNSFNYCLEFKSDNIVPFGWCYQGNSTNTWIGTTNTEVFNKNYVSRYVLASNLNQGIHIYKYDMRSGFYVDNVHRRAFTVSLGNTGISTIPLSIFVMRDLSATHDNAKAITPPPIYWLKVYKDDILIHDLIPVRVGQVGYMYDKVSGQLFGNSGSGSFILGNDK